MRRVKMRKKKTCYRWNSLVLCGLAFFVIAGTAFCMAVDSKEKSEEKARVKE